MRKKTRQKDILTIVSKLCFQNLSFPKSCTFSISTTSPWMHNSLRNYLTFGTDDKLQNLSSNKTKQQYCNTCMQIEGRGSWVGGGLK